MTKEVYIFDNDIDICLPENQKVFKEKLLIALKNNTILHQDELQIIINLSKNSIVKLIKNIENYKKELEKNQLLNMLAIKYPYYFIKMKNNCIIKIKDKEYGIIIMENLISLSEINNLENFDNYHKQLKIIQNIISPYLTKPITINNLMLRRVIANINNINLPLIKITKNNINYYYTLVLVDF
jgi:hypothetical protein